MAIDLSVYEASYVSGAAAIDGRVYTADEMVLTAVSDVAYEDRMTHIAGYR